MAVITEAAFGKTQDGGRAMVYTMENSNGLKAEIISYGAAVKSLLVPDAQGNFRDVVLGMETIGAYEKQDKYFGAIIGRCANRIGNACFELNGRRYQLYANDGSSFLHGGKSGFDKKLWRCYEKDGRLALQMESPDGEEGCPGNLSVTVTYALDDDNRLLIEYRAQSDKDTICNLTSHMYFNLEGHENGSILSHQLQIPAAYYLNTGKNLVPDGKIVPVLGTPMDFTRFKSIGACIDQDYPPLKDAGGYDSTWCIQGYDGTPRRAATAAAEKSGIAMAVVTDLPGIQFYSGNFLDGRINGKNHAVYGSRSGFCLETQYYPNAVNIRDFEQPVLKKGASYNSSTSYQFYLQQ